MPEAMYLHLLLFVTLLIVSCHSSGHVAEDGTYKVKLICDDGCEAAWGCCVVRNKPSRLLVSHLKSIRC